MSDKVRQIIRSQWRLRHSSNALVRKEARNLIRVHVEMLRCRNLAAGECFGTVKEAA
jgi:hypothetical protein